MIGGARYPLGMPQLNFLGIALLLGSIATSGATGQLTFERAGKSSHQFAGFAGERIAAGINHWLIPAPHANPGMIGMFRVRDREPVPNLVPWAGEFVGKHLIASVQTLRLGEYQLLEDATAQLVRELISTQAENGYLGPFRKHEQLLGHWDLWGHYHCLLGLLLWHERTGDPSALQAARKVADLVCTTFLDTGKRALDARSDEMNLAIIHSMGWLYRITSEPRYFRMMREIEKDWESAGDYLRTGLNGTEFFQSPRPRWESLHNLQGLVELYKITGEEKYRIAFEHHWRSIARFDLRNTGGFSSGEQATGNPYAPTPIETCCSIAWMALSVDMLELTGDARVADQLELATLNAWAGAQHPTGRWCTYNTPMDGAREASAHTIVFQSRAGTPELNCCSVNGPRGWSMLSDWAVMRRGTGVVLNWLGAATHELEVEGSKVRIVVEGDYPSNGALSVRIESTPPRKFPISLRIPEWASGGAAGFGREGGYLVSYRTWGAAQTITVELDFGLRWVPGNHETRGLASIYWGPLLLAADQKYNSTDMPKLPSLNLERLAEARRLRLPASGQTALVLFDLPAGEDSFVRLCDFASAGASGTHYRSWLPVQQELPAPVVTTLPKDGARLGAGPIRFQWSNRLPTGEQGRLDIASSEDFARVLLSTNLAAGRDVLLDVPPSLQGTNFWRIVTTRGTRQVSSVRPAAKFIVDPGLPASADKISTAIGPRGELIRATLSGSPLPEHGKWRVSDGWKPVEGGGVALNGVDQKLVYELEEWPDGDYTIRLDFRVREHATGRLGQILSAWAAGSDDPLRLVIDKGKLHARVEAGAGYSTAGTPIEMNRWYKLRVEKTAATLRLFLDEKLAGETIIPAIPTTRSRELALGGNPRYAGNEHLQVDLRNFEFLVR